MGAIIRIIPTAPGVPSETFPDTPNGQIIAKARSQTIANDTGARVQMEREEFPDKPFVRRVGPNWGWRRRRDPAEVAAAKAAEAAAEAAVDAAIAAELEKDPTAAFPPAPRRAGPSGASIYVMRTMFLGKSIESVEQVSGSAKRHMQHLACFGLVELVDGGRAARLTYVGRAVLLGAPTTNLMKNNSSSSRRSAKTPSTPSALGLAEGEI